MKLLALGDLHLGAGADYGREPGDRLRDQEQVLNQIAELVEEEQPDVVLFAGDAFEKRRPTPEELAGFSRFVRRLKNEPCDVLAIAGNHDVEHADRITALELFADSIDVHREPGVWHSGGLTVATLPWTPVSRLVASANGGDRDRVFGRAAELLLDAARGLRARISDGPAVLLGHWSVSGASLPAGLPTDQLREVVLPLAELEAQGWDAVILGHIHRSQSFESSIDAAPVFYVGSPMPLNFGEAGVPHGVWIMEQLGQLDVNGDYYSHLASRFIPIESRAFVTFDCDLTSGNGDTLGLDETEQIAAAIATRFPIEGAICKLRYRATEEQEAQVDKAALRDLIYEAGAHRLYGVQPEIVRVARARVEALDEAMGELEALGLYQDAVGIDRLGEQGSAMAARTTGYIEEARA